MTVQPPNRLVTNPTNWTLYYHEFKPAKQTLRSIGYDLAISIVAYPLLLLAGLVISTMGVWGYVRAKMQQRLAIKVLTHPECLQDFANKRVGQLEKQMLILKMGAIHHLKKRETKSNDTHPPIPQMTQLELRNVRNDQSLADLNDFPWDLFIDTDFLELANSLNKPANLRLDTDTLKELEAIRQRMIFNLRQQATLTSDAGDRVEMIKKIAQLMFIKGGFQAQYYKGMALTSSCWLLPTGFFWPLVLMRYQNDRAIYEGKKELLPPSVNVANYADFVDAHNQLVQNNDFLVPYIETIE